MEHLGYVLFCFGFVFGSDDPPNRRGLTLFVAGFWFGDPMIFKVFYCVVSVCLDWFLFDLVTGVCCFVYCFVLCCPWFAFLCFPFDGGLQEHFSNKNSVKHISSEGKHALMANPCCRSDTGRKA